MVSSCPLDAVARQKICNRIANNNLMDNIPIVGSSVKEFMPPDKNIKSNEDLLSAAQEQLTAIIDDWRKEVQKLGIENTTNLNTLIKELMGTQSMDPDSPSVIDPNSYMALVAQLYTRSQIQNLKTRKMKINLIVMAH